MKILSLHCDYIKFRALKKAIKNPEELETKELVEIKEPLGIFTAVEKSDENIGLDKSVSELVRNILELKSMVKSDRVVIYPYAHLSSSLSSPDFAQEVLKQAEKELKKQKTEVYRAPFGYYKEFELKCKGHPLSELSRSIGLVENIGESKTKTIKIDEVYNYKFPSLN